MAHSLQTSQSMHIWFLTVAGFVFWSGRRKATKAYYRALRALTLELAAKHGVVDTIDLCQALGNPIEPNELRRAVRPLIESGRLECVDSSTYKLPSLGLAVA